MTLLSSPSARLPPIRKIHEHSPEILSNLVEYLRTIYNPPVRGTRRVGHKTKSKSSGGAGGDDDGDALAYLRADEFERGVAVRWLTGLVAQASLIQENFAEDSEDGPETNTNVEELIQRAASLLAVCAGSAAAGTLTRRFPFGSPLLDSPVEVQLTDIPISVDGDAATVGAHTWGSACLLAEMVVESPERFGLSDEDLSRGPRILELGAGTGLVSLAAAKYFLARRSQTVVQFEMPTVVATDYHPAVLENLSRNVSANFESTMAGLSPPILVHPLDWSAFSGPTQSLPARQPPLDEPFDIIFGADIIYEPAHARWIRDTVAALLRRPDNDGLEPHATQRGAPRFHLLIPLRPTHVSESRAVEEVFPVVPPESSTTASQDLCILEKETIMCEAGEVRPGVEVEYVHYVIGWA
ncbi:hypothetical protein C8Q77DRAFT_1133220 [Trametes polyzona]|nr:hypothetical protein C8Q77DRAFT_1133220 [Trametes polyzona]